MLVRLADAVAEELRSMAAWAEVRRTWYPWEALTELEKRRKGENKPLVLVCCAAENGDDVPGAREDTVMREMGAAVTLLGTFGERANPEVDVLASRLDQLRRLLMQRELSRLPRAVWLRNREVVSFIPELLGKSIFQGIFHPVYRIDVSRKG